MQIAVGNMEFNLGPLQSVIALVALVAAVWVLFLVVGLLVAFIRFLSGDETAIAALAEGMMALASGEERVAMARAAKAERFLHKPELTNLITAQAAEMAGDRKQAEQIYKRLLEDERTRFVGIRGIMKQKLEAGDTDTALKLAEKAFALKPRHAETGDILLALQATRSDWSGARKTLGKKVKAGALPRDVGRRRDGVLALQEARGIFEEGNSIRAREAAIEANKLSPDLVPAAVLAAQSYAEQGNKRYASRLLTKAWGAHPHPDLAACFAGLDPDETPQERLKRFRALTNQHPDHPETRMLLAELHIAAEDFAEARKALGDLTEKDPTQRSLTLMAAIDRGQGADDDAVRAWLTKAVTASRGEQWVCDKCGHVHGDWVPVCADCHAFDTLSWKEPSEGEVKMHGGTEMLPLLVGKPSATVEVVETVAEEAPEDTTLEIVAESSPEPSPEPEEAPEKAAEGEPKQ
ncbi:MAG: heme biosynthesis protein HemY [Alphaproteobacteria bacterium]|nr:MAG: heme biosynthesis protein HemY [Alphaproteobacteria bacterium]